MSAANRDLLLNAVSWLTERGGPTTPSAANEGAALRLAISRNRQIRFWIRSIVVWPFLTILLGAVILVWTGVASWKIMVSAVAGGLLIGWIGQLTGATDLPCWYQLLLGGFAFGTVFMATDPVTSAQTEKGKWIYGFLVGALAVTVRFWNPGYAEGMMLAILLMNTFAPLIDHCVVSAATRRRNGKTQTA